MNEEGHALNLVLIVECQAADISIGVCGLALMNLVQDLRGIGAAEHWQLPQCPIPSVVVAWNLAVLPKNISQLRVGRSGRKQGLVCCGGWGKSKLVAIKKGKGGLTSSNSRQGIHPFLSM